MTKIFFFSIGIIWCINSSNVYSQTDSVSVIQMVLQKTFSGYEYKAPEKKKILSLQNKSVIQRINPFTYLSAALLFFYQRLISEQLQANCMYEISCSEFTKKNIEQRGFVLGLFTGIHQLNNCFPGALDDHCTYFISNNNKIINSLKDDR